MSKRCCCFLKVFKWSCFCLFGSPSTRPERFSCTRRTIILTPSTIENFDNRRIRSIVYTTTDFPFPQVVLYSHVTTCHGRLVVLCPVNAQWLFASSGSSLTVVTTSLCFSLDRVITFLSNASNFLTTHFLTLFSRPVKLYSLRTVSTAVLVVGGFFTVSLCYKLL